MKNKIFKATCGPKHHLFGFHDLIAFNKTGEKVLSLETDLINRPPLPGEEFGVGYSLWQEQRFVKLGTTVTMNYPQGARQQWISNSQFIVNNVVDRELGADIYDVDLGCKVQSINGSCHILSKDKKKAYGINYARLHRLGGYGYIGVIDRFETEFAPINDGIFVTDIESNKTELLVSIAQVVECDKASSVQGEMPNYLTHLVLSPDGNRIAFLHRFFLPDGGIRTRLMTIGVDGQSLRCLACGFLSHFDWKDPNHIYIWGRIGGGLEALRSNSLLSNPMVTPILSSIKRLVKMFLVKTTVLESNFLMIADDENDSVCPFATEVLVQDGHPMTSPMDNNICICDTYPNTEGVRELFFYDFLNNKKDPIGFYKRLFEEPDIRLFPEYTEGVDKEFLNKWMSPELFSFTRSGLHCDLHPRWNYDGTMVAFDSIHEGSRQIYIVKK